MSQEQTAIDLLAQVYIMCCEAGDFSNGVSHQGIDEGRVNAGKFLYEVSSFLKGKSEKFMEYNERYVHSSSPTLDNGADM